MSGHSKWSTIKRAKGVADLKRGMTFTKIANAISIAAKIGSSGDPDSNPRLRMVLDQARAANMPKDNVSRAIDRGLGKLPGQSFEEVLYEGFGPGRVAFVVEGVTDNKMRTTSEVKNLFDRAGGSLAGVGSIVYMFDRLGEIKLKTKGGDKQEEELALIDFGALEVEEYEDEGQKYLVYCEVSDLNNMSIKITQAGFEVESAEIVMKPNVLTEIKDVEVAKKVVEFSQKLEEKDDIQKVFSNFDIPDDILNSL